MTELLLLNSESATNRLVLLHGWGADENDLVPFGKLLTEGFKECFEIASFSAPQPHPSGSGRQWYPLYPHEWEQIPNAVSDLEKRLNNLCLKKIPLDKTLLLGFSQGGAMAQEMLQLPLADRIVGVVAIGTRLVRGMELRLRLAELDPKHLFWMHGEKDVRVSIQDGWAVAHTFEAAGWALELIEHKKGHMIPM